MNGEKDDPMATLRRSQDLMLLDGYGTGNFKKGVYFGEGPRGTNQYSKFVTSMDVLIDEGYGLADGANSDNEGSNITVCSISIVLKSAVVTSLRIPFNPQYAEYLDYLSRSNGDREPPRPILYHENWLDYISPWAPLPVNNGTPVTKSSTGNVTYLPRNFSRSSTSPVLTRFAQIFLTSNTGNNTQEPGQRGQIEAAALEIVVGGAFVQLMSFLNPSHSQYTVGSAVTLPDSLMPEPRQTFPNTVYFVITVDNLGYGFRLSSRTGILGMVVLITHAVIALVGSLWVLFWERRVIAGWDTIPDYIALGIGSSITGRGLENTCAGISRTETLGTMVMVGETTFEHLEITLAGGDTPTTQAIPGEQYPKSVFTRDRYGTKYGYRGDSPRRKEKLE